MEHKLDLLLYALQHKGFAIPTGELPSLEGIQEDACPVCGEGISLSYDFAHENVERQCGCRLPVTIVPGISELTKPIEEKHGGNSSEAERRIPSEDAEEGAGGG
jgi:hypothetical protein